MDPITALKKLKLLAHIFMAVFSLIKLTLILYLFAKRLKLNVVFKQTVKEVTSYERLPYAEVLWRGNSRWETSLRGI